MNIAVVCFAYPVCSGRYISDAFKRLGHDVRVLGHSTGQNIWGMQVDPKYIFQPDAGVTGHWNDWRPDLIILAESAWQYHHPHYADVPHVVYGADNHVRDYDQRGIAHYFLMHKAVSIMTWDDARFTWLPACYDPTVHTPSTIAWHDREYDVALIGYGYPQRQEAVEKLAKAGMVVHAGMGALFEEYAAIYHNARIALNVSAASDLSQRIFETAAMGCAVLTDELPDLQMLPNASVRTFNGLENVVEAAQQVLADGPPHHGWVKPHTWDNRCQQIIDWYQEIFDQPQQVEVFHTAPDVQVLTTRDDIPADIRDLPPERFVGIRQRLKEFRKTDD